MPRLVVRVLARLRQDLLREGLDLPPEIVDRVGLEVDGTIEGLRGSGYYLVDIFAQLVQAILESTKIVVKLLNSPVHVIVIFRGVILEFVAQDGDS